VETTSGLMVAWEEPLGAVSHPERCVFLHVLMNSYFTLELPHRGKMIPASGILLRGVFKDAFERGQLVR